MSFLQTPEWRNPQYFPELKGSVWREPYISPDPSTPTTVDFSQSLLSLASKPEIMLLFPLPGTLILHCLLPSCPFYTQWPFVKGSLSHTPWAFSPHPPPSGLLSPPILELHPRDQAALTNILQLPSCSGPWPCGARLASSRAMSACPSYPSLYPLTLCSSSFSGLWFFLPSPFISFKKCPLIFYLNKN